MLQTKETIKYKNGYERAKKRVKELNVREQSLLDTLEDMTKEIHKNAVEGKANETDSYVIEEVFNMYRTCRELLAEWREERDDHFLWMTTHYACDCKKIDKFVTIKERYIKEDELEDYK